MVLDIKVLSRNLVYIDGERIKLKRLFYDGYINHTRDVFVHDDIVIKIDVPNQNTMEKNPSSPSLIQCKIEVDLWKGMNKKQRLFFQEPIAYGNFIENGITINWIVQKKIEKTTKKIHEHKDWDKFVDICLRRDLLDVFTRQNTCVDESGRLVCFDWAM